MVGQVVQASYCFGKLANSGAKKAVHLVSSLGGLAGTALFLYGQYVPWKAAETLHQVCLISLEKCADADANDDLKTSLYYTGGGIALVALSFLADRVTVAKMQQTAQRIGRATHHTHDAVVNLGIVNRELDDDLPKVIEELNKVRGKLEELEKSFQIRQNELIALQAREATANERINALEDYVTSLERTLTGLKNYLPLAKAATEDFNVRGEEVQARHAELDRWIQATRVTLVRLQEASRDPQRGAQNMSTALDEIQTTIKSGDQCMELLINRLTKYIGELSSRQQNSVTSTEAVKEERVRLQLLQEPLLKRIRELEGIKHAMISLEENPLESKRQLDEEEILASAEKAIDAAV